VQYEAGQFAMLKGASCKRGDAADHVLHIYDAFNVSAEASTAFTARWQQDTRTSSSRPVEVTTLYLLKLDQPLDIVREQAYLRSSVRFPVCSSVAEHDMQAAHAKRVDEIAAEILSSVRSFFCLSVADKTCRPERRSALMPLRHQF